MSKDPDDNADDQADDQSPDQSTDDSPAEFIDRPENLPGDKVHGDPDDNTDDTDE
jgi:hypothetical protein